MANHSSEELLSLEVAAMKATLMSKNKKDMPHLRRIGGNTGQIIHLQYQPKNKSKCGADCKFLKEHKYVDYIKPAHKDYP